MDDEVSSLIAAYWLFANCAKRFCINFSMSLALSAEDDVVEVDVAVLDAAPEEPDPS